MTKKQSENGIKKGRVLVDCRHGRINTVVELTDSDMEAARASGEVDDHPDSVRYAETLAVTQS